MNFKKTFYLITPSKKKILWNIFARDKEGAHENRRIKRPSQLHFEHSRNSSFILLVNAQVYINIDQGIH